MIFGQIAGKPQAIPQLVGNLLNWRKIAITLKIP